MRFFIAALLTMFAILISLPVAADWPMTGHDPAHTRATELLGPTGSDVLWSYTPWLPPDFYAQFTKLAVADGRVYWSGSEVEELLLDYDYNGKMWCFDSTTGTPLWSLGLRDIMGSPTIHHGWLFISAMNYDNYYGTSNGGGIYCRDAATGTAIWSASYYDPPSSPVVADGVVLSTRFYNEIFYGTDECWLTALDAETGSQLWEYEETGPNKKFIRPAVSNGRVYSGWSRSSDGLLQCIDLHTGNLIWQTDSSGANPVVCGDKVVYEISSLGRPYAFDSNTGALVWSRPDMSVYGLAADDSSIYITDYYTSSVSRLDKDTGETIWVVPTANNMIPTLASDYLYLTPKYSSSTESMQCIDIATGGTVWTGPVETTSCFPAISDGNMYVFDWDTLYCVNTVLEQTLDAQITCTPPPGQTSVDAVVDLSLTNLVPDFTRRFYYRLALTLPDGSYNSPWRQGWQNVQAGQIWTTSFTHDFPGLGGDWGTVLFELEAQDVTPPPYNQPPYAPSGTVRNDACSTEAGVVDAALTCEPSSGTLPFASQFEVSMTNAYTGLSRRLDYDITVSLANGQVFPHWRRGWQNVQAGQTFNKNWWQAIPAYNSLLGVNTFDLTVTDVTPPPYNQLPYPPAGDTDMDQCTITGSEAR